MRLFSTAWQCIAFGLFSSMAASAPYGIVNFNVNASPIPTKQAHPATLYGCNTAVNTSLYWGTNNQVVANIPYGKHFSKSAKKHYHVTKYYIASPPIPLVPPGKIEITNIGLVTPDRFVFQGEKPAQIVDLDYRVLQPVYLDHVEFDFNFIPPFSFSGSLPKTCAELGVKTIVVDVHCPRFPWQNGALGASGIGPIKDEKMKNLFFLPKMTQQSEPLQCHATVLDDIMLEHKVHFLVDDKMYKTVHLNDYLKKPKQPRKSISLVCERRTQDDIPPGCRKG